MNKSGCWTIVAILFFIGLIGVGLQKIGCLSSDEGIRSGTVIAVTGKEVVQAKNLFVVKYTVTNETRWAARIGLEWTVRKTTGTTIARNPVTLERVPAKETVEQRVMFDLSELARAGIKDPLDADVCTVEFALVSAKDADSEPNR